MRTQREAGLRGRDADPKRNANLNNDTDVTVSNPHTDTYTDADVTVSNAHTDTYTDADVAVPHANTNAHASVAVSNTNSYSYTDIDPVPRELRLHHHGGTDNRPGHGRYREPH